MIADAELKSLLCSALCWSVIENGLDTAQRDIALSAVALTSILNALDSP
jgi:hypothetical protein